MKERKELNIQEMTIRQKIGMTMCGHIYDCWDETKYWANLEFVMGLIRDRALGAVWVDHRYRLQEVMDMIYETADYPILILRDAESGVEPYQIGRHNALGATGSEELAYAFGKITGVMARKQGYNVICNPVLDMCHENVVCGSTVRCIGGDKVKVTRLAMAEARGLKDGGVLTVAKHYPGSVGNKDIDSHMAEKCSMESEEDLVNVNLYPYLALNEQGLLDGIMTQHCRFPKIDPVYPASLSSKVIGIIRKHGFDGMVMTDALNMMGAAAKFGKFACKGLAIGNGNDLALVWHDDEQSYNAMLEAYQHGVISDARLDDAVRHVLAMQHKVMIKPVDAEVTQEDLEKFHRINRDGVYARADAGLDAAISRDGRHYFAVLVPLEIEVNDAGKVDVDTQDKKWYRPAAIMKQLNKLFPNSDAIAIHEYPTQLENQRVLEHSVDYDDVVFITYMESQCYVGRECLTSRITSLIQALQVTNRISALVHFGNPFVVEDLVHIPRVLIGGISTGSVECTLDVLAGNYPAKGVLTYDVKFQ